MILDAARSTPRLRRAGPNRRVRLALFAGLLAATTLLAGCGGSDGGDELDPGSAESAPDYGPALERAPRRLAELYEPGGVVLDAGLAAFERQLEDLRGFPVVVNKWASWCGPCREEFPMLQSQAAERLDEVAFVGIDSDDNRDAAETFLRDHPVPYPSFFDPDLALARSLGADFGFPETVFIDAEGEIAYVRRGPYTSEDDLAADIDRYAIGEGEQGGPG
jgi:cytochrome c biogenesis protein CcmG, thiol:disulfide interchange protein DsbE